MILKKLICVFTVLCIILSITGCKADPTDSSSEQSVDKESVIYKNSIDLLCCYADSFNPYTATTEINRNLSRLIFDPLVKLNNDYEPIYCLAENVALEGTVCTVRLKSARFTDGSQVTASDVIYSFNLARASSTVYASQLYEVGSAAAVDTMTVVFNLTRHDPLFERLLDFPIIKTGSDKRTNIDDVVLPPIGSGRYIPSEDGTVLTLNTSYFGKQSSITEINLINSPDADSVSHYVEVGATDFYFTDISDGNIVRMSGQKIDINLNHLVYIGINHSYGQLGERNMRYALSSLIDRSEICGTAYYNNATAASGFYPPYLKDTLSVQTLQNKSDLQITVENLEKIGYNRLNESGKRVNSSGKAPTFTLLVNSENRSRVLCAKLISEQASKAGINITVVERPSADYSAALATGNFQLYLGEVRIHPNMDVSSVVLPGGSAAFGVTENLTAPENDTTDDTQNTTAQDGQASQDPQASVDVAQPHTPIADILNSFYSGGTTLSNVAGVLLTEMPVIPVCYRGGLLFFDNSLTSKAGDVTASRSDIFLSAEDWICLDIKK